MRRLLVVLIALMAGVATWAEAVHWRASGRRLGSAAASPPGLEAVIVLGFRNRGRRINYLNRYRVRAGLRSMRTDAAEGLLVLCGGSVAGDLPEAELMAQYARERRGFTGPLRLDRTSTTTRENIANAIPMVEHVDAITIVSNSLHAEEARAYLWMLRPDLAHRLQRGKEHRWGEIAVVKPLAAIIGLHQLAQLPPHRQMDRRPAQAAGPPHVD